MNAAKVRSVLGIAPAAPPPPAPLRSVPMPPAPTPGAPVTAPAAEPPASAKPAVAPGKVTLPVGKWARYAGTLGAGLTVTASAAIIRRGGHAPKQPDDSDVELLREALEEGLKIRFGDSDVPWWLGAALAAGGVYAGMRIGAEPLPGHEKPELAPVSTSPEPSPAPRSAVPRVAPPVRRVRDLTTSE